MSRRCNSERPATEDRALASIVTGRDVALATVVLLGMVILSGVSAFGVRRQREPFHIVAIVSCLLWISALQSWKVLITSVGTILSILVLAVIILNWRRFSRRQRLNQPPMAA